jgi:hypothetical protein
LEKFVSEEAKSPSRARSFEVSTFAVVVDEILLEMSALGPGWSLVVFELLKLFQFARQRRIVLLWLSCYELFG